jgi:hypothetical protein
VRDATKRPVQLAVGLTVLGFVLITLGWNGAANWNEVAPQVPYLISGGIAGLALVIIGALLAVTDQIRRSTAEIQASLEQLGEVRAAVAGPTVVPGEGPTVVAGRTTYHLPECRLVAERSDLQTMSPDAAAERGLAPCRVCDAKSILAG